VHGWHSLSLSWTPRVIAGMVTTDEEQRKPFWGKRVRDVTSNTYQTWVDGAPPGLVASSHASHQARMRAVQAT